MLPFLIAVLLFLAVWALFNPLVGLVGLLGVIFLRPGELYPFLAMVHVERIFLLVALFSLLLHRQKLVLPKVSKALLWFWGAMFCSVPFAFWRGGALFSTVHFGNVVLYHFLIVNVAHTAKRFWVVLISLCAFVGGLAVSSFFLYHSGGFQSTMGIERAVGFNGMSNDPNALGITLVTSLPLSLLLLYRENKRVRWLALPLIGLCVWTIVLTGSRAAYIAFALLSVLFAATRKNRIAATLAVLLLMGTLWVAMPAQYNDRLQTVHNLQEDESFQGRVLAWHAAWQMFKDHPLTGVGATEFVDARGTTSGHWLNVHSLYFQLIAELGAVGTIAFAAFVASIFRNNRRLQQQLKLLPNSPAWLKNFPGACNLSLIGLLFTGYSSHNLYRETWYLLAGLSGAAGIIVARELASLKKQQTAQTNTNLSTYQPGILVETTA